MLRMILRIKKTQLKHFLEYCSHHFNGKYSIAKQADSIDPKSKLLYGKFSQAVLKLAEKVYGSKLIKP